MFIALKTHPWAYPALEVVHLIGIALLVGNLIAFELRTWGAVPRIDVRDLAKLSLSIAVTGFSIAAASGLLLFASQAEELIANRAFLAKMGLIMIAGGNAAWFHARGSLSKLDSVAKLQTLVSGLIWIAAIAAGRWIAYI